MAQNPKHWVDQQAEAQPKGEAPAPAEPTFDPASYDGQPVSESLNHQQLDAVIAHRRLDTEGLAPDATKAAKVTFINDNSVI